jgi:hypothetical protein
MTDFCCLAKHRFWGSNYSLARSHSLSQIDDRASLFSVFSPTKKKSSTRISREWTRQEKYENRKFQYIMKFMWNICLNYFPSNLHRNGSNERKKELGERERIHVKRNLNHQWFLLLLSMWAAFTFSSPFLYFHMIKVNIWYECEYGENMKITESVEHLCVYLRACIDLK